MVNAVRATRWLFMSKETQERQSSTCLHFLCSGSWSPVRLAEWVAPAGTVQRASNWLQARARYDRRDFSWPSKELGLPIMSFMSFISSY
jgi:hypothetical protein